MILGRPKRLAVGLAAVVALSAGAPLVAGRLAGDDSPELPPPVAPAPARPDETLGRRIFFRETFRGNGRTCAACHRSEDAYSLSPALARRIFEADPSDPLFLPKDSDDGAGKDFTTLLQHALVRVTIRLHPDVRLVDDPGRRTIQVLRAVPPLGNVALTAPYMQDGRAETLELQARGAIRDHFEPGRQPRARELAALARFQSRIFDPQRLSALAEPPGPEGTPPPEFSTPVTSPAAKQGKDVFARQCRRCHGGETGHLPEGQAQRFANVFVSEANRNLLPTMRLAFRNGDGTETIVETSDPGRAAVTGRLGDLNAFDTPPLRGIKHTAPYFHDHSAATLFQVIDHYNAFGVTNVTFRERDALVAYLETL